MTDKNTNERNIWNIGYVKKNLSDKIVACILPIHAFLGCDTVSRVKYIGNGSESLKKIICNQEIMNLVCKLNDEAESEESTFILILWR